MTVSSPARWRALARLHAEGIEQGFLSSLGERFLALLYEAIERAPDTVLVTHEEQGQVVGFAAGAAGLGSVYRQLLRRPFALARALLPLAASPRRVWRMLETVFRSQPHEVLDARGQPVALPRHELLSIAVTPAWRGRGVAEKLHAGLVEQFGLRGVTHFRIVVGESLLPAHRFYLRMGARPVGRITVHRGAASVVYVQTVPDRSGQNE